MSVKVIPGLAFVMGGKRELFSNTFISAHAQQSWDITPDDQPVRDVAGSGAFRIGTDRRGELV